LREEKKKQESAAEEVVGAQSRKAAKASGSPTERLQFLGAHLGGQVSEYAEQSGYTNSRFFSLEGK
jgi:hypothetical protein